MHVSTGLPARHAPPSRADTVTLDPKLKEKVFYTSPSKKIYPFLRWKVIIQNNVYIKRQVK